MAEQPPYDSEMERSQYEALIQLLRYQARQVGGFGSVDLHISFHEGVPSHVEVIKEVKSFRLSKLPSEVTGANRELVIK